MSSTDATQDPSFAEPPQLSDATVTVVSNGGLLITGADDQFRCEQVSRALPAASPPAEGWVRMEGTAYESE